MTKLEQALQILSEARKEKQDLYSKYQDMAANEQTAKDNLMFELQKLKLKSARTDRFTATIAQRENIVIDHEPTIIEWLKNEPNIESDVYIGLKKTMFDGLAKAVLKKTGEVIPGTDIQITEYLSLRENKSEKSKN